MVALAATKSAIKAVLRVEDDDFTLKPVSPEMFVASFRSRELRDRASTVSVSQEWPPVSTRQVEAPAVEVPLREALTGIGPTNEATAPPPHTLQAEVISAVDSVTATNDHPPPEPCVVDGGLPLTPVLADDDTPPGFTPCDAPGF
jgi:hypothetical protein